LRDKEIVNEVLKGNKEKFEMIIEQYEGLLKSIVYGMTYDIEQTQDLVQEIFLKSYLKINSYNPSYSFKSWLTTLARNHTIDYLRKKRNTLSIHNVDPVEYSYTDKDNTIKDEHNNMIEYAIRQLDENDRALIFLKYHEGYSNEELASCMNIPYSNIRTKIFRAKEKLGNIIKNMEYFKDIEV